jgi:hydroxypyruvate reductase/glycerate 2-kinase
MCDKESAREIFLAGLLGVMPENMIPDKISYHDNILQIEQEQYDLKGVKNLYIFGSGKAAIEMAKAMEKLLKERITKSLVVSNYDAVLENIEVIESSHPLPTKKSIVAAERLISAFESMKKEDFFIYLLSGGSSALIEKPINGVSLEDFSQLTKVLLHNGLSIDEINTIRKNFSQIKGGGLAGKTDAKGIVLVISDVIGDDLQAIASAPLLEDNSTWDDVKEIIYKYKIFDKLPKSIQKILNNEREVSTKKVASFPHYLIGSNKIALQYAEAYALKKNFSVKIVTDRLEGDVKEVTATIMKTIEALKEEVLLFGGEPTVEVKGEGKGGRNQELVLRLLQVMREKESFTFLSAGSDGIDGNSDAAGGVVCLDDYEDTLQNYLENSDAYHYLKDKQSLIMIGESGTNVMDIMVVVKNQRGEQNV